MPIMRELSEEDDVILGKPGGLASNARYMSAIQQWGPHYANAMKADKKPMLHQVYSHLVGSGLRFFVKGGGPDPGGNLVYEPADEARATASIRMSLRNHSKHPSQLVTVSSTEDANKKEKSVAGTLEDGGSIVGGGELSHGEVHGGRRLVTGNEAPAGAPLPGLAEVNLPPQKSGDRPMAEVEANGAEGKKKRDAEAAAAVPMGPETHRRRTDSGGAGAALGAARHSPSPSSAGVPTAAVVPRNVGVNPSGDRRDSLGVSAPASGPPVAPAGRRVEGMSQEEDGGGDGARAAGEGQLRAQGAAARDAERRALRARLAALDAENRALRGELRALLGQLSTLWRGGEERREAPSN
jgi:hypothetical protein